MADGGGGSVVDLLLPEVRRFAAHAVDSARIDREGRIPDEVLDGLRELGLFALTIPDAFGGLGLSLGDACRVVAAVAEVDCSVATAIGLHAGLGTRGLVELGAEPLRRVWLPRLASGDVVASFCATEPNAGSDLTRLGTVAVRDGDGLRLDGEKAYVTNGGFAGLFTVLARTPGLGGARGTSLLCVPRHARGLSVGAEEHKLGIRGSSTVTVHFDGVHVPLDHVLGEAGRGLEQAHRLLEWGRTILSSGCIGTGRTALAKTLAHVTTRRQRGRSIAELAATRAHVARMASRLAAMEALVGHVGAVEDRGEPIGTLSAAAKILCSEGAFDACDRAIQLHGALGFIEDTGVARLLRDCRVTRIFEGANDVLLVRLGTALLADPRTSLERRVHTDRPSVGTPEAVSWHAAEERLSEAVAATRGRLGVTAVAHQVALQHLARAHVALLASSALLARPPGEVDRALVRHAVGDLLGEVHYHLDALVHADESAACDREVTDMLYAPFEDRAPVRRALGGMLR